MQRYIYKSNGKRNITKTMKKIKTVIIRLIVLMAGFFLVMSGKTFAKEKQNITESTQIIFLLDASKSMKTDNQWMAAADSVCLVSAVLPEAYETALLVYNTEIVYQEDFGNIGKRTRNALESMELQGYTSPAAALEKAMELFDDSTAKKRVVFISDGEISMKGEQNTLEAVGQFEDAADNALKQNIKIDMFAISNSGIENKVSYGSQITQGELYVVDSGQTIEEAAEKYLFQTSGIGKIELGESVSSGGSLRVDLQDIYMQNAKIFLVSDEKLKEFHVTGQCGLLNMIQGSRFAVAKLENPLEEQITVDYSMENKGNVRIYLMKEYFMEVNMEKTYTSEEGSFALRVDALNHQDKSVFDVDHLRKGISISIDGKNVPYDIVDGTAVVPYQAAETHNVIVAVDMDFAGSILHYEGETETVELIVPVIEEKPDYRILYIVLGALFLAVIILFSVYYRGKQKKNVGETVDEARRKDKVKYDFSGKLTVYLMTGEREEDIPPCSIKLFGRPLEGITFNWIKNRCGIGYALADADKVRFMGGRDHSLCFINDGCATVVKESQILQRGQRYSLYYGEKILLIFNNGATEIELHYQNIKPSER